MYVFPCNDRLLRPPVPWYTQYIWNYDPSLEIRRRAAGEFSQLIVNACIICMGGNKFISVNSLKFIETSQQAFDVADDLTESMWANLRR